MGPRLGETADPERRARLRAVGAGLASLVILAISAAFLLHAPASRGSLRAFLRSEGDIDAPFVRDNAPKGAREMNQRYMLSAIATVGVAAAGASAQDAVQWRPEDGGNGHWYRLYVHPSAVSYPLLFSLAESAGGHAVTLANSDEARFVAGLVPDVPSSLPSTVLLGAYRSNGAWAWVTGEPWVYTNWGGQGCPTGPYPNNGNAGQHVKFPACPSAWTDLELYWDDYGNESAQVTVIEWSADCNNDGIVDYGQILAGALEDLNGNGVPDCCDIGTPCEPPPAAVQWTVEAGGNGHWYKRFKFSGCILENVEFARARGGEVVCVSNGGEWNFLKSRFFDSGPFCLGALGPAITGGGWAWASGEPWTFEAWAYSCGKPDNGAFGRQAWAVGCWNPDNMEWDDFSESCLGNPTLLIEWSADCNGDGIVDYGQILSGELEDLDGNGVPDCCTAGSSCAPCAADLDRNGAVDGIDLAVILNNWGTNGGKDYPNADIDGDGTIGGSDLAQVLGNWGLCP
jgi:hypothetical protein